MKQKPSNPAKINLSNIGRFIQGYSRKFSETFGLLAEHKQEQVLYRQEQALECTKNGSCVYCGCDTPAKYYSDEGCEDPERKCYPEMMNKEVWEAFKLGNGLEIKIDKDE